MINPEPRLLCLNSLSGASSKNFLKRSSLPKNLWKGISFPKGEPARPLTIVVVLIFTTVGLHFSARSAKDTGSLTTFSAGAAKALWALSSAGKESKSARRMKGSKIREKMKIKSICNLLTIFTVEPP